MQLTTFKFCRHLLHRRRHQPGARLRSRRRQPLLPRLPLDLLARSHARCVPGRRLLAPPGSPQLEDGQPGPGLRRPRGAGDGSYQEDPPAKRVCPPGTSKYPDHGRSGGREAVRVAGVPRDNPKRRCKVAGSSPERLGQEEQALIMEAWVAVIRGKYNRNQIQSNLSRDWRSSHLPLSFSFLLLRDLLQIGTVCSTGPRKELRSHEQVSRLLPG